MALLKFPLEKLKNHSGKFITKNSNTPIRLKFTFKIFNSSFSLDNIFKLPKLGIIN